MAYSSSLVLYGRGKLLVIAVGMGTEIGKIASLMEQTKERQTPLQKTLDQFSKKLSIGIMIVCLAVFVINLFHGMNSAGLPALCCGVGGSGDSGSSVLHRHHCLGYRHQ